MRSKSWGQEMLKRGAEQLQIVVEEKLAASRGSWETMSEGKANYERAMEAFSVVLRQEFEGLVKRLQDYKVRKEDGIIEFRLEGPTRGLKSVVDLVENWILPFVKGIESEQNWLENWKILETLHLNVTERIEDLSKNEIVGGCLSYSERFFVKGRVETFRLLEEGVGEVKKKNRLSLKRKMKIV